MTDDGRIDALLARAADDVTPLSQDLRAAILVDAAEAASTPRRTWFAGLAAGLPAAAIGLCLGLAQPALVLQILPGPGIQGGGETALLDEVFGTWENTR